MCLFNAQRVPPTPRSRQFAFMENIDYIYMFRESSPNIIAIRSLLPTFMHMACSSVFAFGIFFYMETKKIKYLFIFYFIAAATHAFYNSYLTHLIIIFIILYYARLIRALISISPFYDEKKIKLLKKGAYILGASFVALQSPYFPKKWLNYIEEQLLEACCRLAFR